MRGCPFIRHHKGDACVKTLKDVLERHGALPESMTMTINSVATKVMFLLVQISISRQISPANEPVRGRKFYSMDDPALQGDEQILIRTQGVHVKSISFEGILTTRRITPSWTGSRAVLPPKEIPLSTIQSVEPGENAIRDQVLSLGVITRTGGARQMVLTSPGKEGGTGQRNAMNGPG